MNNTSNCNQLISAAVYSALASQDLNCASEFRKLYAEPVDQSIPSQIANANRFWRYQLGLADVSTTSVRECLMDDCDLPDWIRLFTCEVAPVVTALGLPRLVACNAAASGA